MAANRGCPKGFTLKPHAAEVNGSHYDMTFGYAIDEHFGSSERSSVQSVQELRFRLKYPTAVEVEVRCSPAYHSTFAIKIQTADIHGCFSMCG